MNHEKVLSDPSVKLERRRKRATRAGDLRAVPGHPYTIEHVVPYQAAPRRMIQPPPSTRSPS